MAELTWHPNRLHDKAQFWLEDSRWRVAVYESVHSGDETYTLHGCIIALQQCMTNHRSCVDQWKLGKSNWDQGRRNIDSVFHKMRWCLSMAGSPEHILPVAQFIFVIPVSLHQHKAKWVTEKGPLHWSFSTFSTNNQGNVFAFFHHASKRSMMWSCCCDISKISLAI